MPKTVIISESLLKNVKLMEAVENDVFPTDLRKDVLTGNSPLSDNLAIPQDNEFIDSLLRIAYEKAKKLGDAGDNAGEILKQIKEKEKPFSDSMSAFVAKKVCQKFDVPEDKIDFQFNIVDGIDQSKTSVPFGPDESTPVGALAQISEEELLEELSKRKTINMLIAGAADYYTRQILNESVGELDDFSVALYSIYKNYLNACQYNLFAPDRQKLTQNDKKLTGIVIVKVGNEDRKNMIIADATSAPVLIYEVIKGFFDCFAVHGLPSDRGIEALVLSKCDYISAEPWNMRIGPTLFKWFLDLLPGSEKGIEKLLPYIFMKICSLPARKFNNLMREIFVSSPKAQHVLSRVTAYAEERFEMDKLEPKLAGNIDYDVSMVSDHFIEANEL